MQQLAILFALVTFGLAGTASAQISTLLEITSDLCAAPGFFPTPEDEQSTRELIGLLDAQSCQKFCKLSLKACFAVKKSEDKCGARFLKSLGKGAAIICKALGGDKQCRADTDRDIKNSIQTWLALGEAQQAICIARNQATCTSLCR